MSEEINTQSQNQQLEYIIDLLKIFFQSKVKTWWPNGYGDQYLYDLKVNYTHSEKKVQIGFRTIELIQENVSTDENQGNLYIALEIRFSL